MKTGDLLWSHIGSVLIATDLKHPFAVVAILYCVRDDDVKFGSWRWIATCDGSLHYLNAEPLGPDMRFYEVQDNEKRACIAAERHIRHLYGEAVPPV